jgi:hypothetical protein
MSGVPEHIQRQADEAEKKAQEIIAAQAGEQKPVEVTEPPVPAVEPVAPVVETVKPSEAPIAVPPAAGEVKPVDVNPDSDTWKHKYDTLNGIFKARVRTDVEKETAALKGQLESTRAEVQALTAQAQALVAARSSTAELPAKAGKETPKKVGTPEFLKEWGEVGEGVAAVEEKADRALQAVESVLAEAAKVSWERCMTQLSVLVPDWEAINTLEPFKTFCLEYDPRDGIQRQAALDSAARSLDVRGMAEIFNLFKERQVVAAPVHEPTPPPIRPKPDVSPSSKGSGQAPKAGKAWLESEVQAFYTNATKKKLWATDRAEFERIQTEINEARAAGRVVAG